MRIKLLWFVNLLVVMLLVSTAMAEETFSYKFKDKDTLWFVARNNSTTVEKIEELNSKLLEEFKKENYRNMPIGLEIKLPVKKSVASKPDVATTSKVEEKKGNETIVETGDKKVEAKKPVSVKAGEKKVKTKKSPKVARTLPPAKEYIRGRMGLPRKFYDTKNIGRAPTTMSDDKAFDKILLPLSVREKLKVAIAQGKSFDSFVNPGDQFLMTYGQEGVGDFTLRHHSQLTAKQYLVEDGGLIYDIRLIAWCKNWTRYVEKTLLKPPPISVAPPPAVKPPTAVLGPPVEEEEPFEYLPPPETYWTGEHEPIVGAWAWQNELARGWGAYGEYLFWARKGRDYIFENGWSPGIGIYGMYSEGESRINSYEWIEKAFGPQIGIKYIAGGVEDPWQWQLKLRLVWEEMSGGNEEGYEITQDNLKLGFYTEFLQRESEDFVWGVTLEAWEELSKERTSTWIGDTASHRGIIAANLLGQWKLNEDWQLRVSGGPFYQAWDRLTGIHLQAELRWNETVMFGPTLSFFPFGLTSVYDGVSASSLTTYGAFVRVEFGKPIRDYYANKRMEAVKAADRQWLDDLLKTKFANET